jgi:hypothetical protein
MEFERHISEMQTKYNNIKPNKRMEQEATNYAQTSNIITEIIPIPMEEEQKGIDEEDIEIGKTIIRNYHSELKSLINSNLDYHTTMNKINSCMYYIKDNLYVLDKDIADGTIKACDKIVERIKQRFETSNPVPIQEVEVKETEVSNTEVPAHHDNEHKNYTTKDLSVLSTLKSLVTDNTAVSVKLANFQWYKSFLQTKNNEEIESVCNNIYQSILSLKQYQTI